MVGLSGNRTAAGVIWSTSCSPLGWGSLWRGIFLFLYLVGCNWLLL
jgi:hypothetical protein